MFADSLLDSSPELHWGQRSQRGWSTLTSFGLQGLVMLGLLLVPLFQTIGLPLLKPLTTPISLTHLPDPILHIQAAGTPHFGQSVQAGHPWVMPREIPHGINMSPEAEAAPEMGSTGPYIPGSAELGSRGGVPDAIGDSLSRAVAPPAPAVVVHPRISRMMEGYLMHRVQPEYPSLARMSRVQGDVVLSAVISKEGTIENLHVESGHPLLVQAAINAVRQWRYRPYVLNNEAVEVDTRVVVKFSLSGS